MEPQDNPLLLRVRQEGKAFETTLLYQRILEWLDGRVGAAQTNCEKTALDGQAAVAYVSDQQGRLAMARKFQDIITQLTKTGEITNR